MADKQYTRLQQNQEPLRLEERGLVAVDNDEEEEGKGEGEGDHEGEEGNESSPGRGRRGGGVSGSGKEKKEKSNSSKKILFNRAKKLKKFNKNASSNYMKHFNDLKAGPFDDWTKEELVELLITHGFELRNSSGLELISLRDLVESIYQDRKPPLKPKLMTVAEFALASMMARRIQDAWIGYTVRLRELEEEYKQLKLTRRLTAIQQNNADIEDDIGDLDAMYSALASGRSRDVESSLGTHGLTMGLGESTDAATQDAYDREEKEKVQRINVLDLPWVPPSWVKAELYADYTQPRKGGKGGSVYDFKVTTTGRHCCLGSFGEQFDLWEEGQISEFGIYGAGITNYFKFLKWCAWLFIVISILDLATLVINIYGPNPTNVGLQVLGKTTVGNLVNPLSSNATSSASNTVRIPGCSSYGIYDIDCHMTPDGVGRLYMGLDIIVCFVMFIAYFWLRYFQEFEERELDKNTVNASMFTVMVSGLPPDTTEEEVVLHFSKVVGNKADMSIAAVSFAYDNLDEVNESMKRGGLIQSKVRLVHQHRYFCTDIKRTKPQAVAEEMIGKARQTFFADMKKINEQLKEREEVLEALADLPSSPIYAFVTFNTVAGRTAVLDAYGKRSWFGQNEKLRIRVALPKVEPASEPSTIIWENLTFTFWDQFWRRATTLVLSLGFIMFSLIMIVGAKYFEETTLNTNREATGGCPNDFETTSEEAQIEYVNANPDYLYCYCDQFNLYEQGNSDACEEYARDTINAQIFVYFSSVVVVLVNMGLEQIMKYFVDFEKHHTADGRANSVFFRLFILKYINTAVVFFINGNSRIFKALFNLSAGSAREFTPDWFNTVGLTIILVQLGDIAVSHSDSIWKYWCYTSSLKQARLNPSLTLTQDEMNKLHVGPDLEISYAYAQLCSTFFVCLTFSFGIPLLYLIAAVNFAVYYFVEKYMFINMYAIPPQFNARLGHRVSTMLPLAFMLHISMSIWIISNKEIFGNQDTSKSDYTDSDNNPFNNLIKERLSGENTLPLTVFLMVMVVYEILSSSVYFQSFWRSCVDREKSSNTNTAGSDQWAGALVTYTRAVQRNIIKSLNTYNILQNPSYKDSFAITWKFAVSHKRVRSVRNLKNKAHSSDKEDDASMVDSLQKKAMTKEAQRNQDLTNRNKANKAFFPTRNGNGNGTALRTPPKTNGPALEMVEQNRGNGYGPALITPSTPNGGKGGGSSGPTTISSMSSKSGEHLRYDAIHDVPPSPFDGPNDLNDKFRRKK